MKYGRIIVPAYNEEQNIPIFYEEITKYIKREGYEIDILYVNDGSTDNTLEEIKKLHNKDKQVKYISLSRNFGKEPAMHAGLINSQEKDFVVIIDCDLQQPPELVKEMINHYEEGYKIVYTKGRTRKNEPLLRTFFANWFYKIYNFYTEMPLENGTKDFQLLDKQVVQAFLSVKDNYRFVKGIFSWVGYSRKCIEYDYIPRMHGKGSWNFKSLFKYAFNGMNQFSTILLALPIITVFLSFLLIILDIILMTSGVFTISEMVLGLQISVTLLMLGILTYVMIYLLYQNRKQSLNRPVYLIGETSEDIGIE